MKIFTSNGKGSFTNFIVNVKEDSYLCAHMSKQLSDIDKTGNYSVLAERLIRETAREKDREELAEKLGLEGLRKFRYSVNQAEDNGSFYIDYQLQDDEAKRWCRVSVYAMMK